ncbi:hypothetical protein IB024_01285 [Brucella sp. 6810]|uniref:hypothetical protein n=1 Tax=Brucella sp. 6810 TaxID=2769351 RepID=UPI00165C7AF9|nr:hypothetical protein [Brucella sp. 6810]QNQ62422.1 hypothetical protein IB024_01285 [Brucella sp. 6810]
MRFALFFMLMCGTAQAQGAGDTISEKALPCLREPSGVPIEYSVAFEVKLANNGNVLDITAQEYAPKTPEGKTLAKAFSRAIERCQPYEGIPSGTVLVKFSQGKSFINPFK